MAEQADFVVEITGLGGGGLAGPGADTVRDAVRSCGVVVLRGLPLTPSAQVALTRLLGEPEPVWDVLNRHPDHPDVQVISSGGRTPAVGAQLWHTDRSFQAEPTRHTILHGRDMPPGEGDTLFADLAGAYDAAPSRWKRALAGAVGVHVYDRLARLRASMHGEDLEQRYTQRFPPVRHPVVRVHPETGRRALYVNELCLDRIEDALGEPVGVSVEELHAHATAKHGVYRHRWRPGDVVIWDNARVLHRATALPPGTRRVLHRSTTAGGRPRAATVSAPCSARRGQG
jgi:taurine dioxygenase